ncbi:MAG: HEAT repeat domain-containing protein [Planctomycetes bacterium]|nr:HEAT repeat domain-containing protein [Planctomycetota bacterium]
MAAHPARTWLIVTGVVLVLVQLVLVLAWWMLPRFAPEWTAQYSPWPEPALRAMEHDPDTNNTYGWVTGRLSAWGSDIGPALRRKFDTSDVSQRQRLLAVGFEVARRPGVAHGTEISDDPQAVTAEEVAHLREDLRALILAALADGSSYLPVNAAFLAEALGDREVVPAFCDYLAKQKSPISDDLESVVHAMGRLGDPRAVAVLIPLLPIRHKPHPVVDEALDRCLTKANLPQVLAAMDHAHEVIRQWAARQAQHFSDSPVVVSRLSTMLDDQDRYVRIMAIQVLADIRYVDVGARLLDIARNEQEDLPVRLQAMETMGFHHDGEALPFLRSQVTSDERELKLQAITALGMIPDNESIPRFIELLKSDDVELVRTVRWSLERMHLTQEQRRQIGPSP